MGTGSRGCGRSHLRHSRGRVGDGRRAMDRGPPGRRKLRGASPPGRRRAMPARTDTLGRSVAWAPTGARTRRPTPTWGAGVRRGQPRWLLRSVPALVEKARPLMGLTAEEPPAPPTPGRKGRAGPREPGEAHWLRHAGLGRPSRPRSTAREPALRRRTTTLRVQGHSRPVPRGRAASEADTAEAGAKQGANEPARAATAGERP